MKLSPMSISVCSLREGLLAYFTIIHFNKNLSTTSQNYSLYFWRILNSEWESLSMLIGLWHSTQYSQYELIDVHWSVTVLCRCPIESSCIFLLKYDHSNWKWESWIMNASHLSAFTSIQNPIDHSCDWPFIIKRSWKVLVRGIMT